VDLAVTNGSLEVILVALTAVIAYGTLRLVKRARTKPRKWSVVVVFELRVERRSGGADPQELDPVQ
jgi:hypothetical protein